MYKICVLGGCGHVGLPLSIALANEGHDVTIYDINVEVRDLVRQGVVPFVEFGAEEPLAKALSTGKLVIAESPNVIQDQDVIISIVGTPVDEHLNPTFDLMLSVMSEYLPYFRDDQVLILRSTVFPGTSEKIHRWFSNNGKNVHVAFCPERIAEGYAMTELYELPQLISSFSKRGLEVSRKVFGSLTNDVVELQPMEAEITKLFNNAWRYIKFATANQFYMIANDFGMDFYKIHQAMTFNYPRASDFPRPGFAAGPCLFKDTMQLSAFANNSFFLGHSAMLINEGLPNYIVKKIKDNFKLSEMTVGILGMAFKAGIDDKRESLSYKLRKLLTVEAGRVLSTDPFIKSDSLSALDTTVDESDLLIIATPHKIYKDYNYRGKPVVDIWNLLGNGAIV